MYSCNSIRHWSWNNRVRKFFFIFRQFFIYFLLRLKDLEIIKKLDKMYTFKLIPYSISAIDDKSETCMYYFLFYILNKSFLLKSDTKDETKTICGNAKIFRKKYNVKASQIACQVLIEEGETYHFTHITCATNVMIERKW